MNTSDILKRNVPEYQQDSVTLDSYLEAAGEFLDGTKEAIVHFDYAKDYEKSTDFQLSNSLLDRGLTLPTRLNPDMKRRLMRDVAEIYGKNGTTDALIHAIRAIGAIPELRIGWIFGPKEMRDGFKIDPVTKEKTRYDITRFVYTDMLYGGEVVTDDGVFFEGYLYEDPFKENKLGPFPILGEQYDSIPASNIPVEKTPYVVVRFEEGNLTLVTDPVIDPDSGEVFEYSATEQFQLIDEVLRYFLVENNRPTTIRIIVIVVLQPEDEELLVSDETTDEHTYHDDGGDVHTDGVTLSHTESASARVNITELSVGDLGIIGAPSPYASRFSAIEHIIGDDRMFVPEIYTWNEVIASTYDIKSSGSPIKIPMRGETDISFVAPRNSDIVVNGYTHIGATPVVLATVPYNQPLTMSIPFDYHFIECEFVGDMMVDFKITVRYRGFSDTGPVVSDVEMLTVGGAVIETESGVPITIEGTDFP